MYCDRLAAVQCDRQLQCGFLSAVARDACVGASLRGCLNPQGLVHRAEVGLATYDPVLAADCYNQLGSRPCAALNLFSPYACGEVFDQDAGTGAPCWANSECRGICDVANVSSCGTCVSWVPPGAFCDGLHRCEPGVSDCPVPGADGGLIDGGGRPRCEALFADGAPCSSASDCASGGCNIMDGGVRRYCGFHPRGAPCDFEFECSPADYCRGLRKRYQPGTGVVVMTRGVCSALVQQGQPCVPEQYEEGCVARTRCFAGQCRAEHSFSQPIGAPCSAPTDCTDVFCRSDQLGQPLLPGFTEFFSDGGPVVRTGTCAKRVDAGAPCDGGVLCEAGSSCTANVCRRAGAIADPCTFPATCQQQLTCADAGAGTSTCQFVPRTCGGAPCPLPDSCVVRDAGAQVCQPASGNGALCTASSDCASGRCWASDGGVPNPTGTCRQCY